jgi:hypothetical protein
VEQPPSDFRLPGGPQRGADPELDRVADAVVGADPTGTAFADVLRETYDQLYDPSRTGRFSWSQLRKTEKTHMGTLVEINVHRAFDFGDGAAMDYEIAGVDVDCKYSQAVGGWEFPPEAYEARHLCLVLWADELSRFSVGVIRAKARRDTTAARWQAARARCQGGTPIHDGCSGLVPEPRHGALYSISAAFALTADSRTAGMPPSSALTWMATDVVARLTAR